MTDQERFLRAARAEGGQSVSVAGSTLLASAVGFHSRVSARTISTIIRGTTRIDAETKGALNRALEFIESDAALGSKDSADAVETIDRLREELSEVPPDFKRVRRFLANLTAISTPAAKAVEECRAVRESLAI